MKYLRILSSEPVFWQIKGITACLRPSIKYC